MCSCYIESRYIGQTHPLATHGVARFNEQTRRNSFRGVSILLIFKPQISGFPRRDYGPSDMPVYIERYMKVEEDASR